MTGTRGPPLAFRKWCESFVHFGTGLRRSAQLGAEVRLTATLSGQCRRGDHSVNQVMSDVILMSREKADSVEGVFCEGGAKGWLSRVACRSNHDEPRRKAKAGGARRIAVSAIGWPVGEVSFRSRLRSSSNENKMDGWEGLTGAGFSSACSFRAGIAQPQTWRQKM